MSFDTSRFTFDPWHDYLGVVMEQGRVQLDSDWNEWVAELGRRMRTGTLDTLGRAVYPATTPFAFQITPSAGALAIGAGRMYVDGLLAENHGPFASAQWDPALDEMSGAPQIAGVAEVTVDYTAQPYLPGATLPAGNGPFLVYLDVWQRAVTYLEDTNLVDKAVNVDTTGRIQTVWQVKLLDVSGIAGGVICATPDAAIPAWQALIPPSAGQLTTDVTNSTPAGPCCLASTTGYTGMENQFYRVQIHTAGTPSGKPAATFKWSRDNASVITAVTAITPVINTAGNPASQLTLQSMGRDQWLGFAPGNWIEITDDFQELNGQAGELHQIDSIVFAQNTITLDSTVSTASFPLTLGATDPTRHTRITRWDSPGAIAVPAGGATVELENGITAAFGLNPATGSFYVGDYWTFAARTADGSVEKLNECYPRGIHHHYARLAVITFPTTVSDCRAPWPPAAAPDQNCCCTVTVQPGDITGTVTLQSIIDKYQGLKTPTEICLGEGTYSLASPLRFQTAHSNIGLKACAKGAVVIQAQADQVNAFTDGLVVLDNVANVSLRDLSFVVPRALFTPAGNTFAGIALDQLDPDVQSMINGLTASIGLRPVNCSGLTIENCAFSFPVPGREIIIFRRAIFAAAILASGQCSNWRVTGTSFQAVRDFTAGLLLTPCVTFALPPAPAPVRRPGGGFTTTGRSVDQLRDIFLQGTSTPNLAARGGTVLPSILDEAVFENNTFSNLSIAVLTLCTNETIAFTGNEVDNCTAGFWLLSPLQAGSIPADPNDVTMTALSIAMGYPLPQGDTTPAQQIATVAAAPASVRIYTGRGDYTDSQGNTWLPDGSAKTVTFSGGSLNIPAKPATIVGAEPSSLDDRLYQSERFGPDFTYTFNTLPAGYYTLTLKFAEITWKAADIRVFDVSVNGQQVLTDYDVFAHSGGADIADDLTFANIAPNAQGDIVVEFTGTQIGSDDNAKISAAELDPQWNGVVPAIVSNQTASELINFYTQLAQLAQQGFVASPGASLRLRISDNELQGLSSVGILILGDDQVLTSRTGSLVMTANRIETAVSYQTASAFRAGGIDLIFFTAAATITLVTRCLVSSNMVINDGTAQNDGRRFSLVLYDPAQPPQTPTVPPPEIMVSANICQGLLEVLPARFPATTNVPAPMNSWNFLNTVID